MAWPCGLKIPPLTVSRSPRSMPALRGIDPTSRHHDVPSNAVLRSAVASIALEQRVGAVLELHHHALERGHRGLDLEQAQHDGLVGAEQLRRSDAVDERVADLAGGAGDGDVDRWLCHGAETTAGADLHGDRSTSSSSARASASSAMRSAAPWSARAVVGVGEAHAAAGTAAARRRGRRPCRPAGRAPPSPTAARRARRASRRRRRAPASVGPAPGANGREPGTPSSSRRTASPSGSTPGRRDGGVDRAERDAAAPTAAAPPPPSPRRCTCGAGRPWRRARGRRGPVRRSSDDAVARAVEAVDVGLEPVAQRDAGHARARRGRRRAAAAAARAAPRRARRRARRRPRRAAPRRRPARSSGR